jgi:hypothetical protein
MGKGKRSMNELEIMREYLNKALQDRAERGGKFGDYGGGQLEIAVQLARIAQIGVLIRLAEAQERQAAALEKLASTVVPMLNGEKCINTFDNSRYNG